MKQILLHKVFDEGIRLWLSSRFDYYLGLGQSEKLAYANTYSDADFVFGTNWKAK